MASAPLTTPAPAQQPGLPAFVVYDRLPEGCVAYPVTNDDHLPLLRAGEIVIVDPEDREPQNGEFFVVDWGGLHSRPKVIETYNHKPGRWSAGARHRGWNAAALGWGNIGDFVGDAYLVPEHLSARIKGKVVGILEPMFAEPKRLALA